ncbi:TetR/AcrR family transcriptional regulator [Microbacterium sp.]|uniref:TetR/AcrR family transcriptional regulator n=1 Tax=Microbacterium sp. TaxID=51671 RepID=UPI003F6FA275
MKSRGAEKSTEASLPPATQERSRASLERVLDAAVALLVQRGAMGFTIAEVSALAGVAVGTIYGRVGSKESLLLAVSSRELDRIDAETTTSLQKIAQKGATITDAVALLVDARLAILTREATLLRAIIRAADEYPATAGRGNASGFLAQRTFTEALGVVCRRFDVAVTTDDLEWAGDVVEAVATRHLSIGLPDHAAPARRVDSRAFAERLTLTVTPFLLARATPAF